MQKKYENLSNIEAKYNFQALQYRLLPAARMKSCTAYFPPPPTSKYSLKMQYLKSDLKSEFNLKSPQPNCCLLSSFSNLKWWT